MPNESMRVRDSPVGRTNWRDDEVLLEEYEHLREGGTSDERIAKLVGMTPVAFEGAMMRAKKRGDPRAAGYKPMSKDVSRGMGYREARRIATGRR